MYIRTGLGISEDRNAIGFLDARTAVAAGQEVLSASSAIFGWIGRRGRQKVAATQIVDEAERLLQQNLEAYRSSNASAATREQALRNFEQVWQVVLSACSDATLGDAGRRCISERQRGGKWDWFRRYYDPIRNDDRAPANSPFIVLTSAEGGSLIGWALPVALILGGLLLTAQPASTRGSQNRPSS